MPCEEVWIHPKWNYYHYIRGYLSVYLIRPYYYHYLPCPYCLLLLHGIVVIPNILYSYSKLQGEDACIHPESKYINIKYLVIIISYLLIYYYYLHSQPHASSGYWLSLLFSTVGWGWVLCVWHQSQELVFISMLCTRCIINCYSASVCCVVLCALLY